MSEDVVLRARWVVPVASPPIENGWVAVRRQRIVAFGRRCRPADAVDLGDAAILPGLVNAHTHLEFSDVRSPLDAAGGLPGWIARVVALRRGRPTGTAEDDRLDAAVRAGLAESLDHGVTTLGEIATAVPRSGFPRNGPRLRVFREALGLSFAGSVLPAPVRRDLDRLGTAAGVSPHAPMTVSQALGRALLRAAARRRIPACMHLAESRAELDFVAAGEGPFRELFAALGAWPADRRPPVLPPSAWIGRLARLPRAAVVHGTFLGEAPDPSALDRLSRHRRRVAAIVCPRTTRHLSGILPPVRRFLDAGVRVGLGTDGRVSNPDLSVLSDARELAGAGAVSPSEAIRMATLDGAWALSLEDVAGRIVAGAPADLVVIGLPGTAAADPLDALLRPDAAIRAVLRRGVVVRGGL